MQISPSKIHFGAMKIYNNQSMAVGHAVIYNILDKSLLPGGAIQLHVNLEPDVARKRGLPQDSYVVLTGKDSRWKNSRKNLEELGVDISEYTKEEWRGTKAFLKQAASFLLRANKEIENFRGFVQENKENPVFIAQVGDKILAAANEALAAEKK